MSRLYGWAACVVLSVVLLVNIGQGRDAERFNAAERERLAFEYKRLQARYAEAATRVERDVDTVRVIATRYKQVRDSVLITDTLRLIEYIRVADSAVAACTELANSCALFRVSADSTMRSLERERESWKQYAERGARRQKVYKLALPAALIGGVVLGAYVRGSP